VSVEFEPVKLGRRRRKLDPVAVGLAVVVVALVVAVVKPWGGTAPELARGPEPTIVVSPTTRGPAFEPDNSPPFAEPPPPAWVDIAPVVSRRDEWGIRAIVFGPAGGESGVSRRYSERWTSAGLDDEGATVLDVRDGRVVALGVTFPPAETPLDVRIWLDHGGNDSEWIDARPVNRVPGRGAYLFLRGQRADAAVLPWEPGRYRVDVLAGDEIRRMGVLILDPSGVLPDPAPWPELVLSGSGPEPMGPAGLPVGPFAWVDGDAVPLLSSPGRALDEREAWLDLDPATDLLPPSFVARVHQPRATHLGVVLPGSSTIISSTIRRLAPGDEVSYLVRETTWMSSDTLSFVAFKGPRDVVWRPGVYALNVAFVDGDGEHDLTWHVELRPGPAPAEPALLTATRAWAHLAGSGGVLLGWTEPFDGGSAGSPIGLLDMGPEPGTFYAILNRTNVMGCRDVVIPAGATVVGFVGLEAADLAPVTSTIQFPLADVGPMPVLTAAGAVAGLAVAAPALTAELGGPASYGFRAGSSPDAPGYTVCVGLAAPAR
jgi:hypothetical protein